MVFPDELFPAQFTPSSTILSSERWRESPKRERWGERQRGRKRERKIERCKTGRKRVRGERLNLIVINILNDGRSGRLYC